MPEDIKVHRASTGSDVAALRIHWPIQKLLDRCTESIAPKSTTTTPTLLQLQSGGQLEKVKINIGLQVEEQERNLLFLQTLLQNAFGGGSIEQTIHVTEEGLHGLQTANASQRVLEQTLEIPGFQEEHVSLLGPYLLQVVSGVDIQDKSLRTDVRLLKVEIGQDKTSVHVKPFTEDEIRAVQTKYGFSTQTGRSSSDPYTLISPCEGCLSTSIKLPIIEEVEAGKTYTVRINLVNGNPTTSGDLKTLIEDVFLNKRAQSYLALQRAIKDFGQNIDNKDKTKRNMEFTKVSGQYKVTVRGQVPKLPNIVLVIDFEKTDGSKFTDEERDQLRSYSFQLHYRDSKTTTNLQDVTSVPVLLTGEGGKSRNSMSCGFWPYYGGSSGGQINTSLKYDHQKGSGNWVTYESEVIEAPRPKNIKINLTRNNSK